MSCPECGERTWFSLIRHSSSFGILGVTLAKADAWSIQCSGCEHQIDISKKDGEIALSFLPIALKYFNQEIDEVIYTKELNRYGFQFVSIVVNANTYWNCPNCNEESPYSLTECWNCGAANPNPGARLHVDEENINTPDLDKALENDGTDPYGGMKL